MNNTISYQFVVSKANGPLEALTGLQNNLDKICPEYESKGLMVDIVSNTMNQITQPTKQLGLTGQPNIELYFLAVVILKITDCNNVLIKNDIESNGQGAGVVGMFNPED